MIVGGKAIGEDGNVKGVRLVVVKRSALDVFPMGNDPGYGAYILFVMLSKNVRMGVSIK